MRVDFETGFDSGVSALVAAFVSDALGFAFALVAAAAFFTGAFLAVTFFVAAFFTGAFSESAAFETVFFGGALRLRLGFSADSFFAAFTVGFWLRPSVPELLPLQPSSS